MPTRQDPLRSLHRQPPDIRPRSRTDAASLRGFRLLASGIFPAAFMRATSNLTVSTSVAKQVEFQVADWDTLADEVGGELNWSMAVPGTNLLAIRIGGVYRFSGGIKYVASDGPAENAQVFLTLLRNGTAFASVSTHWIKNATFATSIFVGGCVKCEENDTITLETLQVTGADRTIANGGGEPFLEGSWVAMFSGAA